MKLFHGTRQTALPSILQDGLRPGSLGLVWATESEADARQFASQLDYPAETSGGVAVVVIDAPKGSFIFERPLTRGVRSVAGTRVARFAGKVPADWIRRQS